MGSSTGSPEFARATSEHRHCRAVCDVRLAWKFNCGMNGTRGCNKILTGLIWFVPFITPIVLLLPVFLPRQSMLEPLHSSKSRILNLGLIRLGLILVSCVGLFFYSLLEIIKILGSQKIQVLN